MFNDAKQSAVVVRQAVEAMSAIAKSSQQISQIIGVIDAISFARVPLESLFWRQRWAGSAVGWSPRFNRRMWRARVSQGLRLLVGKCWKSWKQRARSRNFLRLFATSVLARRSTRSSCQIARRPVSALLL